MSGNVVLYCEKLPTEGMETLIMELCPPELDLRFLHPVKTARRAISRTQTTSLPPSVR